MGRAEPVVCWVDRDDLQTKRQRMPLSLPGGTCACYWVPLETPRMDVLQGRSAPCLDFSPHPLVPFPHMPVGGSAMVSIPVPSSSLQLGTRWVPCLQARPVSTWALVRAGHSAAGSACPPASVCPAVCPPVPARRWEAGAVPGGWPCLHGVGRGEGEEAGTKTLRWTQLEPRSASFLEAEKTLVSLPSSVCSTSAGQTMAGLGAHQAAHNGEGAALRNLKS